MMQELDDDCESRIFNKYTVELEVKYLYNHLNAAGICLRTSFNFKIGTNHRAQKWDGNTTKYWRLVHRQNYKKIAILIENSSSNSFPYNWITKASFVIYLLLQRLLANKLLFFMCWHCVALKLFIHSFIKLCYFDVIQNSFPCILHDNAFV